MLMLSLSICDGVEGFYLTGILTQGTEANILLLTALTIGGIMISDILSEAVSSIRQYLQESTYTDTYSGSLRVDIIGVVSVMEAMRIRLDTPADVVVSEGQTVMIQSDNNRKNIIAVKMQNGKLETIKTVGS